MKQTEENSNSSLAPSQLNQISDEVARIVFLKSFAVHSDSPWKSRTTGGLEVLISGRTWTLFSTKAENSVYTGSSFYFHKSPVTGGEMYFREDRISELGRSHCISFLTLPLTDVN